MGKLESSKKMIWKHRSTRWVWQVTKGKHRYVAALAVLQILLNICVVCYSLLFRDMIDRAVERQLPDFYIALGTLAAVAVGQLLLRSLHRWLEEYTRAGMENTLKRWLFGKLNSKSYAGVQEIHTGEWMNRLTSDTVIVADGITQIIPQLSGIFVRMVGAFGMILIMEPLFGILIVPAGLVLVLAARLLRPGMKRLHADIQRTDGNLRVLLQERLDNQLIVRAFAQQERTQALADEKMEDHRRARMRRIRLTNLYTTGFGFAMHGMYILGAVISCIGIAGGSISFGTMTAVLQLISLLQSPLSEISGFFSRWYAMQASAERLMEVEKYPDSHARQAASDEEVHQFYRQEFSGISLENVAFTYVEPGERNPGETPARVTIQDLNLQVNKGEFIAVTGASGCGKSTLLKLLMGLYTPDSGKICLRRKTPLEARLLQSRDSSLFAYVPQGNQLMSGTIRQILAFDDPEKMRQETKLWQALKVACADDFVDRLPDGLDTALGEHGSGLSEGQIQRIALARAIFSGRPILLLDESTSALDEQTEQTLLDNLRTMTDHTVLLVTHRTRACEICDRVLQLRPDETNLSTGA